MDTQLRVLARSNYWQTLFQSSQKCAGISLFDNKENFSGLQLRMIYWLGVYSMLYEELATFEDGLLTEAVIENNFRCDCYLIHRKKKHESLWKKHRQEEQEANRKARRKKPFKNPGRETNINVKLQREPENGHK